MAHFKTFFFNKFVNFVIFLNTQMDLFILKTDMEKFTSTNKKTLHLIFKRSSAITVVELGDETKDFLTSQR